MEEITLGQIVLAIGTLSVIGGFMYKIADIYKKNISDKFHKLKKDLFEYQEKTNKRISTLETKVEFHNKEIEESKEERLLLIKSELACLKGLQELNCNGPVTQGIEDIEEFLIKKTHD